MSDLGILVSKFTVNSKSLKEFDEALRYLRGKKEVKRTSDTAGIISKLLNVVNPIAEVIEGNFSESTAISERKIVNILKNRHEKEWPSYKKRIIELSCKLGSDKFQLSNDDYQLLNDIADALDVECAYLFRRISGR
jgi:hypothetical protein